jgi:hypothetical protein
MKDYEYFNDKYELRGGDLYHRNSLQPSRNGRLVGQGLVGGGYKALWAGGKVFYQHRVVWLLTNKAWPANQIDHINHDKTDNRPANLRVVTCGENLRNMKAHKNNTSGETGVSWNKVKARWVTRVGGGANVANGRRKNFTTDGTPESKAEQFAAAVEWVNAKRNEHNYHENHGKILTRHGA